jgi:DNA-binding NtrC family response regulator
VAKDPHLLSWPFDRRPHGRSSIPPPLAIGTSESLHAVLGLVEKMARSDAPVLIQGETGSGKERSAGPFVAINCGAIPDGLIETELFGHGAGAFTDAAHAREGVIAQAWRGTLFLDEINTLSPRAQVTLLRFLQDFRYRPVGTSTERAADVRVIAASNERLNDLVAAGRFRQDLLYRLNILELTIPPLRSRQDDIELLVDHFLGLFCRQYGLPPKRLHPDAAEWLRSQHWPGNVRELENWIHREVVLSDGDEIHATGHAMPCSDGRSDGLADAPRDYRTARARALAEFESTYISQALAAAHGNVTVAARIAGKERRSFGKLLRKHGIDKGRFSS